MAPDWITAMCEIVVSNERRNNIGYDFFHPRYSVKTWTKMSYLKDPMTSYQ